MKTRLLGAAVLIALAVLFVPMLFPGNPPTAGGDQAVSLAIPPAPDRDLQTRTMSLNPDGGTAATAAPSSTSGAPLIPAKTAGAPSDQLATVDIGSHRPRDVETDPSAGDKPAPTSVTAPAAAPPTESTVKPPAAAAPAPTSVADNSAGTAARGSYNLNLSAYSSSASAQRLEQRVRALGYPVSARAIQQSGKSLTLVTAGPFSTRTAAEAARLKITQTIPGAPAHLESGASDQQGDVPPKAAAAVTPAAHASLPTTRAGGFAVQVAAVGSQADANALRDKLRGAGFDGFVDSVNAGGRQLWRVRAGPLAQRDAATRVRDQIKARLGLAGNVVSVP